MLGFLTLLVAHQGPLHSITGMSKAWCSIEQEKAKTRESNHNLPTTSFNFYHFPALSTLVYPMYIFSFSCDVNHCPCVVFIEISLSFLVHIQLRCLVLFLLLWPNDCFGTTFRIVLPSISSGPWFLSLVSISKLRFIGAQRICLFFRLNLPLGILLSFIRIPCFLVEFVHPSLASLRQHALGSWLDNRAGTALCVVTLCGGHVTIPRRVEMVRQKRDY